MARRNRKASKTNRKARTSKEALRSELVATPSPVAVEPIEARAAEPPAPEPLPEPPPVSAAPNSERERVTVPELPAVQQAEQGDPAQPEESVATKESVDSPRVSLDAVDEAFFQQAEAMEEEARVKMESFPPVAEDLSARAQVQPPSPAVLARRNKFRKLVAAVVAAGALFVVGGIGKSLVSRSAVAAEPAQTAAVAAEEPVAAPIAEPVAKPVAGPVATPEPRAAAEPVAVAAPEPVAPEAKAELEAQEKPASTAMGGVADPRAETLKLLNRGKLKEAIPMAAAAIQKEPDHALGYLYLGAALQDSGKHRDAVAAYSDCVRNAKKGPVWECRAMGGRP
jgi:hypothetical protein